MLKSKRNINYFFLSWNHPKKILLIDFGTSGIILKPSGSVFESFGGSFGDLELPRGPPERQKGKSNRICGLVVLPGIRKVAFCRDRTLVFEVCVFCCCFFRILRNGRSVRTERDILRIGRCFREVLRPLFGYMLG